MKSVQSETQNSVRLSSIGQNQPAAVHGYEFFLLEDGYHTKLQALSHELLYSTHTPIPMRILGDGSEPLPSSPTAGDILEISEWNAMK